MRLTELHPEWMDGYTNRQGIGIIFDCPKGCANSQHYVPFANPIDGGPPYEATRPHWTRVGDTFDTLQLTPSILSDPAKGGCGWHGYIGLEIPGEVTGG